MGSRNNLFVLKASRKCVFLRCDGALQQVRQKEQREAATTDDDCICILDTDRWKEKRWRSARRRSGGEGLRKVNMGGDSDKGIMATRLQSVRPILPSR